MFFSKTIGSLREWSIFKTKTEKIGIEQLRIGEQIFSDVQYAARNNLAVKGSTFVDPKDQLIVGRIPYSHCYEIIVGIIGDKDDGFIISERGSMIHGIEIFSISVNLKRIGKELSFRNSSFVTNDYSIDELETFIYTVCREIKNFHR